MKSLYWRRKACQPDSLFLAGQSICAILLQTLLRFGRAQSFGRGDFQLLGRRLRRHGVPLGLLLHCFRHHGFSLKLDKRRYTPGSVAILAAADKTAAFSEQMRNIG